MSAELQKNIKFMKFKRLINTIMAIIVLVVCVGLVVVSHFLELCILSSLDLGIIGVSAFIAIGLLVFSFRMGVKETKEVEGTIFKINNYVNKDSYGLIGTSAVNGKLDMFKVDYRDFKKVKVIDSGYSKVVHQITTKFKNEEEGVILKKKLKQMKINFSVDEMKRIFQN